MNPLSAVVAADPYPYYARLVERTPLYRDDELGMWVASSAAAVEAALQNAELRVRPPSEPVPTPVAGTAVGDTFGRFARMTDGEHHDRVKAALRATFDRLDWTEVESTAVRCSDRMAPHAFGGGDSYERYAHALAVAVVASLLGVSGDALDFTASWTRAFIAALGPNATAEHLHDGVRAAQDLSNGVAAGGTLWRMLRDDAQRYDVDEATLIANAVGLLFQSYDATAGLIGNTLLAIGRAPVRAATLDAIVDEVARHDSPVHNTRRFAAADTQVLDARVSAGETVLVILAAANRDAAVNADPASFDPHRAHPRSYTFGLGGHACPGARLACTIATAAVMSLLTTGLMADLTRLREYRQLPNARVPLLDVFKR